MGTDLKVRHEIRGVLLVVGCFLILGFFVGVTIQIPNKSQTET